MRSCCHTSPPLEEERTRFAQDRVPREFGDGVLPGIPSSTFVIGTRHTAASSTFVELDGIDSLKVWGAEQLLVMREMLDSHSRRVEDLLRDHLEQESKLLATAKQGSVAAVMPRQVSAEQMRLLPTEGSQATYLYAGFSPGIRAPSAKSSSGGDTQDFEDAALGKIAEEAKQMSSMEISSPVPSVHHTKGGHWSRHCAHPHRKQCPWLEKFVHSRLFETIVIINIVVNVCTIAVKADVRMRRPGDNDAVPIELHLVDLACTTLFVVELCLRLFAEGWFFFSMERYDFRWNVVDTILAASAVVEGILSLSLESTGVVDLAPLRLFKLGRLLRVLPSIRFLRSLSEVRVLILSILHGLRSVLWSGLVLMFVVLLIAVSIMEILLLTAVEGHSDRFKWDRSIDRSFGDIGAASYTVFKSIFGGLDWGDAADSLWDASHSSGLAFCVFIAFSQLLLLNVMTGIFVKSASDAALRDEETMMVFELDVRRRWVHQVVRVFEEADKEDAGSLSREEFTQAMSQLHIQLLLHKLGIETMAHSPETLFELFDFDGNGRVEITEFAYALQHLHGHARSVEIAQLRIMLEAMMRRMTDVGVLPGVSAALRPQQLPASHGEAETAGLTEQVAV
mmetsp:Transcript_10675/g.24320  ORF Transcript_10675/g.24320 Transcript_10675/m.24320 type:complete len:621 (-) Transcript_10675:157-2019(-)